MRVQENGTFYKRAQTVMSWLLKEADKEGYVTFPSPGMYSRVREELGIKDTTVLRSMVLAGAVERAGGATWKLHPDLLDEKRFTRARLELRLAKRESRKAVPLPLPGAVPGNVVADDVYTRLVAYAEDLEGRLERAEARITELDAELKVEREKLNRPGRRSAATFLEQRGR